MKPTEMLTNEHDNIKEMLHVAGVVCKKMEDGGEVPVEHLEQIVEFIQGYADKFHHAKEEELLFVEMGKAGIPQEGGPVAVMLYDHATGRDFVKEMSGGIALIRSGDKSGEKRYIVNTRAFISLLTEHIYKEDNILYNIANQSLTDEQQQLLSDEFEKINQSYADGGVDKYLRLIIELKNAYL